MMTESGIKEIIDRETRAWNEQNLDQLMSIFHPDMVWPWPRTSQSHDPTDWIFEVGRFNYDRWKKGWEDLFASHELVHNIRKIQKIELSKEGDGAFAVVNIDTLWRNYNDGKDFRWLGRVCKIYTNMKNDEWKMIFQTGVLDYSLIRK